MFLRKIDSEHDWFNTLYNKVKNTNNHYDELALEQHAWLVNDEIQHQVLAVYNDERGHLALHIVTADCVGIPVEFDYEEFFRDYNIQHDFIQLYSRIVASGKKLQLVKLYKEVTGVGLKDAKDYMDKIFDSGEEILNQEKMKLL